jgi:hypothetical protein
MEFGSVVGAGERAVLASEALVVEVFDDPRDRVFLVGVDGTEAEVTFWSTGRLGGPPMISPTSRQASPSSRPFSE